MLQPDSPIVVFGQLFFFGGLAVLMIGLPVFIWLWVRFLRDVHSIAESMHWISHCTQPRDGQVPGTAPRNVKLSAFGR